MDTKVTDVEVKRVFRRLQRIHSGEILMLTPRDAEIILIIMTNFNELNEGLQKQVEILAHQVTSEEFVRILKTHGKR